MKESSAIIQPGSEYCLDETGIADARIILQRRAEILRKLADRIFITYGVDASVIASAKTVVVHGKTEQLAQIGDFLDQNPTVGRFVPDEELRIVY